MTFYQMHDQFHASYNKCKVRVSLDTSPYKSETNSVCLEIKDHNPAKCCNTNIGYVTYFFSYRRNRSYSQIYKSSHYLILETKFGDLLLSISEQVFFHQLTICLRKSLKIWS